MRHFPEWVVGAAGTAALVGAFYAGGAVQSARSAAPLYAVEAPAMATSPAEAPALALPPAFGYAYGQAPAQATRVNYVPAAQAYAQRAVVNEPIAVYRPRAIPVRYQTREVVRPARTVKKSVAIIAGSTAAGATIGGLAKGKRGALLGGLLGGGAATVWDQVTRRRDSGR